MLKRALLLSLVLALPVAAHEGVHEQIEEATHAIAQQPRNAALYLKRAELYRIHREFQDAERDYLRARELDPDLYAAELAMGRMLYEAGRPAEALPLLARYARLAPQDRSGHAVRARTLMALGRAGDAIPAFELALAPECDPSLVLEYTHALVAGNRRADALRHLDGLPPLVTYQLAAIDIELAAGNRDGALRRMQKAEACAARKEEWMERRGDLLLKMGRGEEARAAFQAALDAIATLPPERRTTRAIAAMEKRLRAK